MSYVLLFLTGFLVSRLSLRYGLVEQFFARMFKGHSRTFSRFLLYVLLASAVVSMFTPNFITALTLLPILETLRQSFERKYEARRARRLTTAMAVMVIYGCNIGGMGSLVGSPANALMLGALELLEVPGREKINFLSWFGWSLPCVAVLLLLAWGQVAFLFVPSHTRNHAIMIPAFRTMLAPLAKPGLPWLAAAVWFVFWTLHSTAELILPRQEQHFVWFGLNLGWGLWDKVALGFGAAYVLALFLPIVHDPQGRRQPLLRLRDCGNELPVRGFLFVLGALAVSGFFILIRAPQWLSDRLVHFIPTDLSPVALYFALLFITTMTTEFFSNTTVAVVLFSLVHALATSLGLNPLVAVLAVGLASTNAFMLPIGTPVNALLYGGVKNMSLALMVASGLLLNVLSSAWLALFLSYVIPWYYNLRM